jgi:hypothetical protein
MPVNPPIALFFSYASKDEKYKLELEAHLSTLKRDGVIETWSFRNINAGEEWKSSIDENLERARIILFLISADFLASDYCWEIEMKRALQRHEQGTAIVIPVIVRDCDWKNAPFAILQALPRDGKAVLKWRPRDTGWLDVVQGIRKRIAASAQLVAATPSPASTASGKRRSVQTEDDPVTRAKRAAAAAAERQARQARLSTEGMEAFYVEVQKVFQSVVSLADDIADEVPALELRAGADRNNCVLRVGRISVSMYSYATHPVTESRFIVTQWLGGILLPEEHGKKFYLWKPKEYSEDKFFFELSREGDWCWASSPGSSQTLTSLDLAQRCVNAALTLHERIENGEIPFPNLDF